MNFIGFHFQKVFDPFERMTAWFSCLSSCIGPPGNDLADPLVGNARRIHVGLMKRIVSLQARQVLNMYMDRFHAEAFPYMFG